MSGAAPDDGLADPRLGAALAAQAGGGPAARAELLAALVDARVFVAVAAARAVGAVEATGEGADAGARMAVVLLEAGGVRALPVFADVPSLLRWQPGVRPVRLSGPAACGAALAEGAAAVVVDPAGAAVALDVPECRALAGGWVPVPGSALSSRRTRPVLRDLGQPPEAALLTALAGALDGEPLLAARLLDSDEGPVLGVCPRGQLDAAGLAALARRVSARLGGALPAGGLDLLVVPVTGPGAPVPPPPSRRGRRAQR